MAPHSNTLAWKIPWTEEPGRLQSMGSLRVGHDWATSLSLFAFLHWRRKWQPTSVFLPGESQGRRSLVGCRLWGCTESDMTEVTQHGKRDQVNLGVESNAVWGECESLNTCLGVRADSNTLLTLQPLVSYIISPWLSFLICTMRMRIRSDQISRSVVSDSAAPWAAVRQASLSITNSQSLLKLMSIELVMPSNHLFICHPLLLLPSIFPRIRVFSIESVLCIKWPNYWSFSFSISPSSEYSEMISFRIDWFDLLSVQGTLQLNSSKASILGTQL